MYIHEITPDIFIQIKNTQILLAGTTKDIKQTYKKFYRVRKEYFNQMGQKAPCETLDYALCKETEYLSPETKADLKKATTKFRTLYLYEMDEKLIKPVPIICSKAVVRAHNVFYGILLGNKYSEIEPRVEEKNGIKWQDVKYICKLYGIDDTFFYDAIFHEEKAK